MRTVLAYPVINKGVENGVDGKQHKIVSWYKSQKPNSAQTKQFQLGLHWKVCYSFFIFVLLRHIKLHSCLHCYSYSHGIHQSFSARFTLLLPAFSCALCLVSLMFLTQFTELASAIFYLLVFCFLPLVSPCYFFFHPPPHSSLLLF